MSRKAFYLDILERTAWTFVQAFLAVWLVTKDFDMTNLKVASAAGVVAVAKALVVNKLPWTATNSASTLPAEVDPPAA